MKLVAYRNSHGAGRKMARSAGEDYFLAATVVQNRYTRRPGGQISKVSKAAFDHMAAELRDG
jgi:hypothetical protein